MKFELDRNIGDKVFIVKNGSIYKGYLSMVTFKKEIRGSLSVSDYDDDSVKEDPINTLEIVVKANITTKPGVCLNYQTFHVKDYEIYDTKKEAARAMLMNAGFACGIEGLIND